MATGKSSKKALIWVIPLLAIIGFGGFGAVNFSGGTARIGNVGDTEITANDYARALQNEMQRLQQQTGQAVTLEQLRQFGITDQVLARLVTEAALDEEARRMGLSVGDERVAEELRAIQAFQGPDRNFDREAYAFALQNAGLDEADFEADIRAGAARSLLQAAVLSGTALPDTYTETLVSFAAETRDVTWARLGRDALNTGLPVPTDEDLRAWYDENIDRFTRPETRAITYAWVTPDMIVDSVEVDPERLRAAYDERFDEFNQPERRLVERLVFENDTAAQEAMSAIRAGDTDFETLVEERGLQLADADMGDVAKDDLGAAGEAVFFAETGEVVGPAESPLGPALFRVNGVLDAQETTFEEARPALMDALALDRARRVIEGLAQSLDDELAAGATLEELAEGTDLELGQIDWTEQSNSGIAGYATFDEAARSVTVEDYPEIETLGDGGLFALRLDEVRPPEPRPFAEVRAEVEAGWEQAQATEALVAQAEDLAQRIEGGASFEELGLAPQSMDALTRNGQREGVPSQVSGQAFDMAEGAVQAVPASGAAIVLRIDAVNAADMQDERSAQLTQALRERTTESLSQDLYTALNTDIRRRLGIEIDQQAVNAVLANFQ
ncbi:peptidyl-prolyl cis-trans isomerase [Salipiger mucosus]|uniref:Parvulin-like PPIase n=1 Tax=Salipiger mucosus DSM 16094 TaxID=1123237 RepID=S9QAM4_9RHOB|nr:peptidyl-prolyl cis-trans isomerase [Salipiger mucosus]EPX78426.1 Peptidyl-prolyl cis-trans isomerase ppiD [Salipiger mucosus DSM 16094]